MKLSASLLLPLMFVSASSFADWTLNNDKSNLNFISVKKSAVVEVHHFKTLTGTVEDKSGKTSIEIDLTSPETIIPIRNDRLQSMLFQTDMYPKAIIMAKVDAKKVNQLKSGQSFQDKQTLTLDLHGVKKLFVADIQVTKLTANAINVSSVKPIVLNADDFKLVEGINALRDIAGLPSITTQVPVTFNLVFDAK